jgi:hypothetical protein
MLTIEQKKRVRQSIKETERILLKETSYKPEMRDYALIYRCNKHIEKLYKMYN